MALRIVTTGAALAVGTVLAASALAHAQDGAPASAAAESNAEVATASPTAWTEGEDGPVVVHVTRTVTVKASPSASQDAPGDGVHHGRGNGDDDTGDPAEGGRHHDDGEDHANRGPGGGDDEQSDDSDHDDHGDDGSGHDAGDDGSGHDAGDDHGDGGHSQDD